MKRAGPEREMVNCRVCQTDKLRLRAHRELDTSRYKYVDATGARWDRRRCPSCSKKNSALRSAKSAQKIAQEKRHQSVSRSRNRVSATAVPVTLRKCRSCGQMNVNYFVCPHCISGSKRYEYNYASEIGAL